MKACGLLIIFALLTLSIGQPVNTRTFSGMLSLVFCAKKVKVWKVKTDIMLPRARAEREVGI
jgi:hypothetical protein